MRPRWGGLPTFRIAAIEPVVIPRAAVALLLALGCVPRSQPEVMRADADTWPRCFALEYGAWRIHGTSTVVGAYTPALLSLDSLAAYPTPAVAPQTALDSLCEELRLELADVRRAGGHGMQLFCEGRRHGSWRARQVDSLEFTFGNGCGSSVAHAAVGGDTLLGRVRVAGHNRDAGVAGAAPRRLSAQSARDGKRCRTRARALAVVSGAPLPNFATSVASS